ncbi:ORF6N domain-containing protein [Yersinia pekkanenii]|uniref:ORF6N domain n=1 Tax=Yersinia pekkanenii TaxID=1288385 RepID=A0A0T9PZL9_9GAMM|nr:ORF6N domain-containing protein [Yersinia pekkanenii]CNH89137.1 ORF6N domain [Yersinia pekkanenii]CRY67811.1 ORF6N domain [Yersinia pekkanenii]
MVSKKITALSDSTQTQPKTRQKEILIQLKQLPTVELHDQRVVTFTMIDEAHQRPKGTAKAAFSRHRSRFVEGRHFFVLTEYVLRTWLFIDLFPARTSKAIVITEMGYLLLVKPFQDDLSWLIQEELVNAYFRRPEVVTFHHVGLPSLEELAAMPVMDAQNAVASADNVTQVRPNISIT